MRVPRRLGGCGAETVAVARARIRLSPELTFILLARPDDVATAPRGVVSPEQIKRCRMVGDVNMFLPDGKDGEGECEIMIAGALCLPLRVSAALAGKTGIEKRERNQTWM